MEAYTCLLTFFARIRKDPRISITHIGLYAALVAYRQTGDIAEPIYAYAHEIMPVAKMSACTTYHKCIRDLHDFGYIFYEPSFKRNERSRISLNIECERDECGKETSTGHP